MITNDEQKQAARAALRQARAQQRAYVKLGIDAHLSRVIVVRQQEETSAKAAVRHSAETLEREVRRLCGEGVAVFACYEAGPLGFGLQRRLSAAGAICLVVRPRTLSEYGQKVKTDRRDAAALCGNLDRYLCGNDDALALVAVPNEAEERQRSLARERDHLARQRRRELQRFRGTCLFHGIALRGNWWRPKLWADWKSLLGAELVVQGERLLRRLELLEQDLQAVQQQLCANLPAPRPFALGELSCALIEREIVQWDRFSCRQQVASYTGMIPSEHSSGTRVQRGAITKHGNPHLRHLLVEAAWRLLQFQPDYCRVKKWRPVFDDPQAGSARRKKAVVALARQFAIDLWRWRTGRVTLAQLGLRAA